MINEMLIITYGKSRCHFWNAFITSTDTVMCSSAVIAPIKRCHFTLIHNCDVYYCHSTLLLFCCFFFFFKSTTCLSLRSLGCWCLCKLLYGVDGFLSSFSRTEVSPAHAAILVQSTSVQGLHHVWRWRLSNSLLLRFCNDFTTCLFVCLTVFQGLFLALSKVCPTWSVILMEAMLLSLQ